VNFSSFTIHSIVKSFGESGELSVQKGLATSTSTSMNTEPCLGELLSKLGLAEQYENKLTISTVLEINQNDISGHKPESANSLPEAFVKRLITLDTNTRSVHCLSHNVDTDKKNAINPLDLSTAIFLCSDGFLQQDMVLKMSLCQFAVPLLLPNQEQREITMMLWSMREIVQTFSPSIQAFSKMSCEERMVLSDVPLVSFVRLGRTAFSKSELLNRLFSNNQHYHDTFYHRNMECGDVPRKISEGLVEITWYLPCGNKKIDKFTEPVAVANLRGDIKAFDLQFSFLCQTSAAVYVFCDESEADYFKNLEGRDVKADVILISSVQGKTFTLKTVQVKPSFKATNESQRRKNPMELLEPLHKSISKVLESSPNKVSIANMAKTARDFGILVDEDSDECQSAKKNVNKVTRYITDTSVFKATQLPSQGQVWKAISWIENEYWRLRNNKSKNKEDYRESLKTKEKDLRQKQQRFEKSPAMSDFLHGVVTSEVQRYYFLKWLEIDLENVSWDHVSRLQNQYKEICQKFPQDEEKIADIDKQISDVSLCLKHFFRECGQLYECSNSLPEHSRQRKTMENLPALHAQMLLDGFPVELVDGDASNIPIKWITDVLTELHNLMHSSSKVKVIAVIGSENSGKSTLLNSMFGVRFAVSRGRGTRGAFIQLINVHKDIKVELGCDCIMLIDTEGLKPHQMVENDHSHERDKEVASLAVALSDITIVSLAKGNSREEDVLEIVLQAFTRLKDKGEKQCHIVCSNMADLPAAEKRKSNTVLVQQLNKIIQKDVNMKKANITKISEVMKFDPETCCWNIPPLRCGTPPMAPVSGDYSKIVHTLKTRLLGDLRKSKERGDLTQFVKRLERVWKTL
uniref:Upregulator of cell proliferation n=1 Tax=Sphaeramia orbicularis TaxID=375764 RepID=A0A672YEC5_9TELE